MMKSPGQHIFRHALTAAITIAAVLLVSCSPRKNTAASRNYQAFITRYNIYYNGDTHYKETLKEMETAYEDDYSQLVPMHPAEARANPQAPQPNGDFTRSIEKGQKAIQLRSIKKRPASKGGKRTPAQKAWLKRDEYNPFLHNAWMMMGRGQYFNGDFLGAASTFFYISRHFTWLPATVTEAQLWQARSYISLGWLFEAEIIINRIKENQLTNGALRGLYNFVKADYLIKSDKLAEAVPFLKKAVDDASGSQKIRLRFLLGQVYARIGDKAAAYEAFKKAGSSPSAPYRTKFNARIKQSEVFSGADITPEVNALRRMTRYDRNKEYLDQIYYAIGNLYLSRDDTTKAIENYVLAAEKSTRNGIDKAINQITLGNLYFARQKYELAQPCYSEAVPLLPDDYPDIKSLRRRSDVLDELAVYSQNVTLQDSLLRLSAMPEDQRLEIINRIIKELEKKEKEEAEAARREEYLANRDANANQLQDNKTQSFTMNTDNSWYFYNTATRNAGRTEFQRRWGARKLEDNWRRRNKSSFNVDDFNAAASPDGEEETENDETAQTEEDKTEEQTDRSADPHFPEYYLAQIPETPEQKATANQVIQEGLYNMGIILKDKLDDYGAARSQFDRLLRDYPDNEYRLDTYYNLYLMYMRQGRTAEAEKFRALVLSDFPDSPYGQALRDPDYIENLRQMDRRQQELYERTYQAYLDNDNRKVHEAYREMSEKYPLSKILPKFMFLHALAYVTEKRPDDFNAVLRELLQRFPDTDITPIASSWLKGMAKGRQLQSGSANMRGMIWDMRLSNDSTAVAEGVADFMLDPADRQLLVMTFPTDAVSSNALLYEIARHNFKSFVVKDFELEQLNFGRLGMIVIHDFENMNELNHYRSVMANDPEFTLPAGVRPVVISDRNFKILLDEGRSFDEYFRYLQEQNYEDTQADILPVREIETLQEADEAAAETPVPEAAPEQPASDRPEPEENIPVLTEDDAAATVPDTVPDTTAAQPVPAPATQPAEPQKPVEPQKQLEPEKPSVQAPAPAPARPAPAAPPVIVPAPPKSRPAMPQYDPGSEGDDPLLD